MGEFRKLLGTTLSRFQIGIGGPFLKWASNKMRARNAADNMDVPVVGSVIAASGDDIEINEDAAGTGADWKYTLRRPAAGMSQAVVLTLPVDDGSPSQVLQTDGSGNLSWSTVASGNDKTVVDTTSLAFGASSPLALFTLPANAVVTHLQIIVDTAFNGAPTVTVGVAGSTSKYAGATDSDLTAGAGTVFNIVPGQTANGSTEALIATYSPGGASAGAARILVHYVIPS